MTIQSWQSWGALALFLCTALACGKRKSPEQGQAEATGDEAAQAEDKALLLGCELAKQCGRAAESAGTPWRNHGEEMLFAAEQGNEAECNKAAFVMLRAAALEPMLSAPAGCKTDMQALFEAVGSPFDNCGMLEQCADALDEKFADQRQLAREVASKARADGKFSGERICISTWTGLLEQAPVDLEQWPEPCGGRLASVEQ